MPHVREPPAAFSQELPGVGTDTLHLLTRRSRKAATATGWWSPISSLGTSKLCLGSFFVASELSVDGNLWVRGLFS